MSTVLDLHVTFARALGITCTVVAAGLWSSAPLPAQTPTQSTAKMSAREIFYEAATPPKPVKPAPAKSAPRPHAPPRIPEVSGGPLPPVRSSDPPVVNASRGPQVELAGYTQKLGIRLSMLKTAKESQTVTEVGPDTVFQPGDRVRLSIQVSGSGYIYVINRGSSGTWTQLFPSPDLPDASNAVMPGVTYSVPPEGKKVITVHGPAGEEKLFIILSRKQEDAESLTVDMSRRDALGGGNQQKERSLPGTSQPLTRTMAMNDNMVDRLRHAYARDLIIETVDEQTPGERKEKAVYAVNQDVGESARVVLDAQIKHQ